MHLFEAQVDKGIELLTTELGSDWFETVDTNKLDLNDIHDCVLGQLFTHYGIGCQKFWPDSRVAGYGYPVTTTEQDDLAAKFGLNLREAYAERQDGDMLFFELTQTWRQKINELKGI